MVRTDLTPLRFTFAPRWKEELFCHCSLGSFCVELNIVDGEWFVYFPTEANWEKQAPDWLKPQRSTVLSQLGSSHIEMKCKPVVIQVDQTAWIFDIANA
jgi:hypothetical protein